jgi:hypothetical protein
MKGRKKPTTIKLAADKAALVFGPEGEELFLTKGSPDENIPAHVLDAVLLAFLRHDPVLNKKLAALMAKASREFKGYGKKRPS